ncbi:Os03g0808250 [Oryza sativa Japonica Group]|uniref:Os03g0808250 protein n=1 Tax=Oryza sativa subsp. japonica TaxID=39947 RepID=A0A0P0W4K9_ORYSJ|nr:Os03g0808250 [Oryza sativa Japonica Group]
MSGRTATRLFMASCGNTPTGLNVRRGTPSSAATPVAHQNGTSATMASGRWCRSSDSWAGRDRSTARYTLQVSCAAAAPRHSTPRARPTSGNG